MRCWWRFGGVNQSRKWWFTQIRVASSVAATGRVSWRPTTCLWAWVGAVTAMTTQWQKASSSYWSGNGLSERSTVDWLSECNFSPVFKLSASRILLDNTRTNRRNIRSLHGAYKFRFRCWGAIEKHHRVNVSKHRCVPYASAEIDHWSLAKLSCDYGWVPGQLSLLT